MPELTCKRSPIYRASIINSLYTSLTINDPGLAERCRPGQFFELRDPAMCGSEHKLFKPISISMVYDGLISFIIKNVGTGTQSLCNLHEGDMIEYFGPLGNEFPLVENNRVVLVSGGIGYPPLLYLRGILAPRNQIIHLHGATTFLDTIQAEENWLMEEGTARTGYVTKGLENYLNEYKADIVYSCGPEPMLKAVAGMCKDKGLKNYASMEAYMACAVGVCHGCAIPVGTEDNWDYLRVCKEGPVFDAETIRWELL